MSSWIKYVVIGIIFVAAVVVVSTFSIRHSTNIASTQEVQLSMKSSETGTIRETATNAIDKEALVANLILETVKAHKKQGKDIRIDYVYLDNDGNITNEDQEIKSVQFKLNLLNDNKEVVSSSTQRVALEKIIN